MRKISSAILIAGLWATAVSAAITIPDKKIKTEWIGNGGRDYTGQQRSFDDSGALRVTSLSVRWDGDKIRGIKWTLSDNSFKKYGGYDDTSYTLTTFDFPDDDPLKSFILRDSGYGYNSLRQIELETMAGAKFKAGPDGFDNEVRPPVKGSYLVGFHGLVNPDNFMQALGLWITVPPNEIRLTNVSYDVGMITRGTPQQVTIKSLNADNRAGTTPENFSSTEKVTTKFSRNWTSTWQVKTGVKVSVEGSIPMVAKVGVEWSAEVSNTQTTGETSDVIDESTVTINQDVPAGKYGRIEIVGFRSTSSVPYTCNLDIVYADGTKERVVQQTGVFLGASTSDFSVKYVDATGQ